jgi:hypothetical protein
MMTKAVLAPPREHSQLWTTLRLVCSRFFKLKAQLPVYVCDGRSFG